MIVVKVGGSLYEHPLLGPGIREYLQSLPEPILLVPGGGDFANLVRQLDALHELGDETSHWLALHSMNLAGEFLNDVIPVDKKVSQSKDQLIKDVETYLGDGQADRSFAAQQKP